MIDIIIPTYNSHESIKKTLLSISLQTIKNLINVYIVDDCSDRDYSKEVEMFKNLLNIKLLRLKKNSGPGVARQFGLDNSNSEFIMFIDSDDLFYDCFSVENIYKKMVDSDYDLGTGILAVEELDGLKYYNIHTICLHGNMYRRSYIEKYNFRFNDSRTSEDNGFNTLYTLSCPKTLYDDSYTYIYRYNQNSITKNDPVSYDFTMLENYIYNTVWFVEQARLRNFDSHSIAKSMFNSCITVYFKYNEFMDRTDLNLIFKWFKPLLEIYKNYCNYLNENEKFELHQLYNYNYIPKISFYDFINLAEMYCN